VGLIFNDIVLFLELHVNSNRFLVRIINFPVFNKKILTVALTFFTIFNLINFGINKIFLFPASWTPPLV